MRERAELLFKKCQDILDSPNKSDGSIKRKAAAVS
jgi:hypothetical protein